MEKFGEKSYFYRKASGLPLADADDDLDLDDDTRAHGFEEIEEKEKNTDVSGGELMKLDVDRR
jgi:hypothetical protein